MGVESKIRELMEGAANRPADKSQGDATAPTQGDSNANPESQDLSGSSDPTGGLTSPIGKAAADKEGKDKTLPKGNGAKAPVASMENKDETESVVNQTSSAGNRTKNEEVETEDEVVIEDVASEEDVALFEADLALLFADDENLTEEFKTKAANIFEAVVTSRVSSEVAEIEEALVEQANVEFEAELATMTENIDKYLAYVTEQWMEQNELAIERGLKTEVTESFIKGLQQLFTENYIEVPDEKYDLIGEMEDKIADLGTKLDEQLQLNIDLNEESVVLKKERIAAVVAEGLATTDAERFSTLIEDVAYTGAESYETKLKIVLESYFPKDGEVKASVLEDTVNEISEEQTGMMSRYTRALTNSQQF